jgi:hypothetical protein
MARKGSPDRRDKREMQAKLATAGTKATPAGRGTRAIWEIRDKKATPDDRVTKAIREIRDKKATPAIEARPLHAPTDSIATPIPTTEGSNVC